VADAKINLILTGADTVVQTFGTTLPQSFATSAKAADAATKAFASVSATLTTVGTTGAQALQALASRGDMSTVIKSAQQLDSVLASLKGNFSDAQKRLDLSQQAAKLAQDQQTITAAFQAGTLSFGEFSRASEALQGKLDKALNPGVVDKFGGSLEKLAKAGIEPIAHISPTAASGLESMVARMGPGGLAATALAGGLVAAGLAAIEAVHSFSQTIERLDNLSVQTGVSTQTLQAFAELAKESGEDIGTLGASIGRLNLLISEANKGNFQAVDANFKQLGVSLGDLVAEGHSTEEVLGIVAQRLVAIENPQQRAAAAADIFGSRSRALLTILDKVGHEGLPAVIEEMKKAGVVTDEAGLAVARAVDHMGDALTRKVQGYTTQALSGLSLFAVEAGTALQKGFAEFTKGDAGAMGGFIPRLIASARAAFGSLGSVAAEVAKQGSEAILAAQADADAQRQKRADANNQALIQRSKQVVVVETATQQARQDAILQTEIIAARASGETIKVIELEERRTVQAAEVERDAKLKALAETNQPATIAAAQRAQIESDADNKIMVAHAESVASKKRADFDYQTTYIAQVRARETAEASAAEASIDATKRIDAARAETQAVKAEVGGDPIAAIQIRAAAQKAASDAEIAATDRATDRKIADYQKDQTEFERQTRQKEGDSAKAEKLIADHAGETQAKISAAREEGLAKRTELAEKEAQNEIKASNQIKQQRLADYLAISQSKQQLDAAVASNAQSEITSAAQVAAAHLSAIGQEKEAQATLLRARAEADQVAIQAANQAAESRQADLKAQLEVEANEAKRVVLLNQMQTVEVQRNQRVRELNADIEITNTKLAAQSTTVSSIVRDEQQRKREVEQINRDLAEQAQKVDAIRNRVDAAADAYRAAVKALDDFNEQQAQAIHLKELQLQLDRAITDEEKKQIQAAIDAYNAQVEAANVAKQQAELTANIAKAAQAYYKSGGTATTGSTTTSITPGALPTTQSSAGGFSGAVSGGMSGGIPVFAQGVDAGPMPGPPGRHGLAWVAGGEYVVKPNQLPGDTFNLVVNSQPNQDPVTIARIVARELARMKRTRSQPVGT
jgi:hypothetical protein